TLQVGDVIKFTAVEGIAGLPFWTRRATILGFKLDKGNSYPLVLTGMHFLPSTHKVCRLASASSVQREAVEASDYRTIRNFVFIGKVGEQNAAASLLEIGKQARALKADVQKAGDRWWKGDHPSGGSGVQVPSKNQKNSNHNEVIDLSNDVEQPSLPISVQRSQCEPNTGTAQAVMQEESTADDIEEIADILATKMKDASPKKQSHAMQTLVHCGQSGLESSVEDDDMKRWAARFL
ncbi:MAG: hypothetical protein SGILL_008625, partial [Bacillariaceae sp.]